MSKRWHIKDGFGWLFPLVIGSIRYLWWPHGLIHKLLTLHVKALSHYQHLLHELYPILFSTRDSHQHSIWSPWKVPCNTAFIRPQTLVPSLHGRKALKSLNSEF